MLNRERKSHILVLYYFAIFIQHPEPNDDTNEPYEHVLRRIQL